MTEDPIPYFPQPQAVPQGHLMLTQRELARDKLRIAWEFLAQVAEQADLLPPAARAHVATSVASLTLAKAIVESQREEAPQQPQP
jgi:hypothetical protein